MIPSECTYFTWRKDIQKVLLYFAILSHTHDMYKVRRLLRGRGSGGCLQDFSNWELYEHQKEIENI